MKKTSLFAVLGTIVGLAAGCTTDTPTGTSGVYTDLHLILNEGPFGSGTGTITAYNADTLIQSAFALENGFPLGNVAQHMIESDSMLYIAMNNSNTIHGVNRNTLKHSWSATVEQPRYLAADGNRLFVSNWKDSSIYVLDKTNGSLVDSIDMGHFTEQLTIYNNKLFAGVGTYEGPWSLAEIDLGTFDVKHHTVGDVPNSFAVIANDLYLLCSGDENWGIGDDTPASIWKYEGSSSGATEVASPSNIGTHAIGLSTDGTAAYFLNASYDGAIVKWTPGQNWPNSTLTLPGGYNLNAHNGNLYFFDAKDYASSGEVRVYNTTGAVVETVPAGVIPRQIIY